MVIAEGPAFEAMFETLFGGLKFSITEVSTEVTDGYNDESFYTVYKAEYTVSTVIDNKPVSWEITVRNGSINGGYEPVVWDSVLKNVVENSEYALSYAADETPFAVAILTLLEYEIIAALKKHFNDDID